MLDKTKIFAHPMYAPAKNIAKLLLEHKRILLSCHANPDADAMGSMIALAYGLKSKGISVAMCNAHDMPKNMEWLPRTGKIHKSLQGIGFKPDLSVVLDCGDAHRLGSIEKDMLKFPSICIDHHMDNPHFGSVANWVDPKMPATGQMIAAVLYELGVDLSGEIAEAIYASISADTGGFRFSNTSEQVLILAAHLVNQGLNISKVREQIDNNWTLPRIKLWGELMCNVRMERENTIALVSVPLKILAKYNATSEDLEGLVENIRRLRGVLAVGVIREINPKECKASLRSTGEISVQAMVSPLGGGGHRNAAGATLKNNLADGTEVILTAIKNWLDANADKI